MQTIHVTPESIFLEDADQIPPIPGSGKRGVSIFQYLTSLVEKDFEAQKKQHNRKKSPSLFEDSEEETTYEQQENFDYRHVKKMFKRAFVFRETSKAILCKQNVANYRNVSQNLVQSILLETMHTNSKEHLAVLTQKLQEVLCRSKMPLGGTLQMAELYRQFESILELMNVMLDVSEDLRNQSKEAERLLKYLELCNPLSDLSSWDCNELHIRSLDFMLSKTSNSNNPIVHRVCTLVEPFLRTNVFQIHQSLHSRQHLQLMVQLGLGTYHQSENKTNNNTQKVSNRNKGTKKYNFTDHATRDGLYDDDHLIQYLISAVIRPWELKCISGGTKFVKKIQNRLEKLINQSQTPVKQPTPTKIKQQPNNSVQNSPAKPKNKKKQPNSSALG